MNLDDQNQQDRKLDSGLCLSTVRLYTSTLNRAETALRRLSRLLWLELAINFAAVVLLGAFLAGHLTEARFLIPGAALDLSAILLLALGVRQLVALGKLDPGTPVVALQKRTESLRIQRLRVTQLTLLAAPLLWTPMLIVGLKGFLGLDVYAILDHGWLAANLAFGLAVIPLAVWISRLYADRADRMERSPRVQRIMRDVAGYHLNAAADSLASLVRFEEKTA